jgi:hypothetical protein
MAANGKNLINPPLALNPRGPALDRNHLPHKIHQRLELGFMSIEGCFVCAKSELLVIREGQFVVDHSVEDYAH